ncbi:MAG: ACP S-malonyltransferase, partial [Clostridiales Family XIII bacterium]|nr:ACP S-malonyltransferase [Clostridiales Family XIII bacterium]
GGELKELIFGGPQEELNKTDITQPAVFTAGVAAWAALRELSGKKLDTALGGVAGFSLGEYGALVAAGVISDFSAGLDIVRHRGIFMAEAGRYADGSLRGAMAAVIGARDDALAAISAARGSDVLEAVNFNAPTQIAVAGDADAIERLKVTGKERKLRVIPLKVSTAFHCEVMEPASERLRDYVSSFSFDRPNVKLYANTTGRDITDGAESSADDYIRGNMALQLKSPVRWQDTIENMAADGIGIFIETGPGKTLCGLVNKILPDAKTASIDADGLDAALELLGR